MPGENTIGLQVLIFSLVAAVFSTIYITQPVLPVLRAGFGASASRASLTISAVIPGIALANLPFATGVIETRTGKPAGGNIVD
ncbi:MAG TPA: hypothetical protein VH660_06215 [Candidatus Deferrimicrobiaceae bacterium]